MQDTIGKFPCLPVEKGMKWVCTGCARCCSEYFDDDWLGMVVEDGLEPMDGRCPKLGDDNRCTDYENRYPACRAFPFTLRKGDDGLYRLVVFTDCPGVGRGETVDAREQILECVSMAEKKLGIKYEVYWKKFDETGGVGLEIIAD